MAPGFFGVRSFPQVVCPQQDAGFYLQLDPRNLQSERKFRTPLDQKTRALMVMSTLPSVQRYTGRQFRVDNFRYVAVTVSCVVRKILHPY